MLIVTGLSSYDLIITSCQKPLYLLCDQAFSHKTRLHVCVINDTSEKRPYDIIVI